MQAHSYHTRSAVWPDQQVSVLQVRTGHGKLLVCQPPRGTQSPSPFDWSKTFVPNWAHSSFILVQTQVLSVPDAFPTVLT